MPAKGTRVVRRPNEDGFAMIASLTVATVALVLALTTMAVGVSLNQSTVRDKRWSTALVVAESGIQDALVRNGMNAAISATPPPAVTGSAAGGEYVTTIARCTAAGSPAGCPKPGYLVANSTGYIPNQANAKLQRKVRVTYGPDRVFTYALFSLGDLRLKNNAVVSGDVFANGNILFENNNTVTGDVISTGGWVDIGPNSLVLRNASTGEGGSVFSGGNNTAQNFGIKLANGVVLKGSAHARRDCPATGPNTTHKILNNGTIEGTAVSWSTISPNDSLGGDVENTCQQRASGQTLPLLRGWAADPKVTQKRLYEQYYCGFSVAPGACAFVREFASVADFQATVLSGSAIAPGVYYVNDPSGTIDMTGKTITSPAPDSPADIKGDFVLRTTAKVKWDNSGAAFYSGPGTATISILVENTAGAPPADCATTTAAITVQNALQVNATAPPSSDYPAKPAVLFYSTGCIDTKNNGEIPGAAYGNPLYLKNNPVVPYDPRVQRILGFGNNRYSQATWNELAP